MAIVQESKGSFGSMTTVVETNEFTVTVSTAKEGFFSGLSTIIINGVLLNGTPIAKIKYKSSVSTENRQFFHKAIAEQLDHDADTGWTLEEAVTNSIKMTERFGVLREGIDPEGRLRPRE